MSKEVKEYLDYLKANEYIWGYEKKDNYIILRYGLSSVKDTETNIKYNDNLRVFIKNIRTRADEIEDDIRNSLVDEKDYYGYDTKEELENRINEEREFLIDIVYVSNRVSSTNKERYSIVIDSNMNTYEVREKKMIECFNKLITPLDIYSQVAISNLEDIYYDFYQTLDKEELKISKEILDNKLYISSDISGDYDVYEKNDNVDSIDVVTCEDIDYHWHEDKKFIDE